MESVKRIYVEKKAPFAVKAKELKTEIAGYLGINSVTAVREFIRYDVENISEEIFETACKNGAQAYMMGKTNSSDVINKIDETWKASVNK